MAIVGPDGTWLKVNNALCAIVGYSPLEFMSMTFQDITYPDDLDEDLIFVNQMLAGEIDTYQMEKRYIHKEGHLINVLLSVSLVKNTDGTPRFFISQIQDITQQKKMEVKLSQMAREDELTKVFNRRYFIECATREIIRGGRFREPQALLMIDIDHFKRINDSYGHAIGDDVLRVMASECSDTLRNVDVFGRLGGEEFGALLLNTDVVIARMLAERLRKRIEDLLVPTSVGEIQFTISIGLATFTEPNLPLEALLKKADEALYEAKATGRNKSVVYPITSDASATSSESMLSSFVRLEWKTEYESGCQTIDRQHQNLFMRANDLLAAIISGLPDTQVNTIAQDLTGDMINHFRDEDKIFRKAGFPDADAHSRIHNSLIQDIHSFLDSFKDGKATVADLFNLMVIKIVKGHMLTEDRKFFPYLHSVSP